MVLEKTLESPLDCKEINQSILKDGRYRGPTNGDPEKKWTHRQEDRGSQDRALEDEAEEVSDNPSPCSETGAPHTVGPGAQPCGGPAPARLPEAALGDLEAKSVSTFIHVFTNYKISFFFSG